jgi:hypothetical protein
MRVLLNLYTLCVISRTWFRLSDHNDHFATADTSHRMDYTGRKPRRTVLRLVGSAAVVGLAGCASDGGAGDSGTESGQTGNGDGSESTAAGGETSTGAAMSSPASGSERTTDGDETQRETRERTTTTETRTVSTVTETNSGGTAAEGTPALSEPVPAVYRTATNQGGAERDPDSLAPKSAVQYQTHPKNGQQCSGCAFYIPDKNGDGLGACTIVQGYIQPDAWCISYSPSRNG